AAPFFRPLALALAPHVELVAVQYPGRHDRYQESPLDSVPALAEGAFAALAHELRKAPFSFFGHSLGAAVAFEVALRYGRSALEGPYRLI
ncbi:alpha/beta fold hydrolase, partial [Streptomyces sp. SID11233]|nr:alpha/beta fold hydrolase [Streptomyces sp. SID11233]